MMIMEKEDHSLLIKHSRFLLNTLKIRNNAPDV